MSFASSVPKRPTKIAQGMKVMNMIIWITRIRASQTLWPLSVMDVIDDFINCMSTSCIVFWSAHVIFSSIN